jgi:KDO2-lipid IV(A) lauroyltransferase
MIKKSISHLGIFLLGVLSLLPLPVLYLLADATYVLLYRVFAYRKNVVRENLLLALPEKSLAEIIKIEKKFFRYLSSLIFEILKMNTLSSEQIKKRFIFHNKSQLQEYLDRGESVLVCSAHYGNWEWGTMGIGLNFRADHYPIYKPLSNMVFDNWFKRIRSRFGNKLVAMRQTMRALAASKGKPSIFSFGNDQAPAKDESHYWTNFLHQQASIQLGIEKIALKTNQPIFYFKVNVIKRGYYEVDCIPLCLNPAETAAFEITEMHTRLLEEIIKEKPEYWLWSHRRWKYKPSAKPATLSKFEYRQQA